MATSTSLSDLIRERMTQLGLTYAEVALRAKQGGQEIAKQTVHSIVTHPERHKVIRATTLRGLSLGLEYPYDVLAAAAADQFGYKLVEVPTSLRSAGSLRIIAAVHEDLEPDQQADLAAKVEQYAAELRAAAKKRANGGC